MKPLSIFGLVLVFAVAAFAIPINSSETGYNSRTYGQNYQDAVADALDPRFNVTISFSTGGVTYLTTPEYTSSTVQNTSTLQTAYAGGTGNLTHYEWRSDMFSEIGLGLAPSNQSDAFDHWYNTLTLMDNCGYGTLPCWVMVRNGTVTYNPSGGNDTAIDGSVRAWTALFIAYQNTNFTQANRTKYYNLAVQMAADTYQYETAAINATTTTAGTVTRLPFGGGDCAASGFSCGSAYWTGYTYDVIAGFIIAGNLTGNITYYQAASNFTAAAVHLALLNDTDGDGFGVTPFNYQYTGEGGTLGYQCSTGGPNTYYCNASNVQWDDSDAPRYYAAGWAESLAARAGLTGYAWDNLSAYITAWIASPGVTNAATALQYYYNGTPTASAATGYYTNGLGALLFLDQNATDMEAKLDEAWSHYSWTGQTYDSTSGGNALTYRGIRPLRALAAGMNWDLIATSNVSNASTTLTNFNIYSPNTSTNITGGSAVWYADIRTFGAILVENATGIYFTNISWNQTFNSKFYECSAASISMTNGTHNTSEFTVDFASDVVCVQEIIPIVVNTQCRNAVSTMVVGLGFIPAFITILIIVASAGVIMGVVREKQGLPLPELRTVLAVLINITIITAIGLSVLIQIC